MRPRLLIAGLLVLVIGVPVLVKAAEPAKLAVVTAKLPEGIAEPIRTVLDSKSLVISEAGKPAFEFWLRKELPLADKPAGGTIGLGTLEEGLVLGVVRVDGEQRYDFRNEEIPKGLYVVRLGIQPEDGNHLGVAPTRTFALLIPASQDTKLDPISHKDLMKAAAAVNAAKHPSNLNIQPVENTEGEFPRLGQGSDSAHKVLIVKIPARPKNGTTATTLTFAIVYDGQGQI